MKFARDCRSSESNEATAQLLFEALPWIKNLTGKTVVIKYGGAAMVDEQLRRDVMSDIVLLKIIGMRPVIVHGGGKAINEALSHYDIPVEFKNGQRVTTPAMRPRQLLLVPRLRMSRFGRPSLPTPAPRPTRAR